MAKNGTNRPESPGNGHRPKLRVSLAPEGVTEYFRAKHGGEYYLGDSLKVLEQHVKPKSVDLIMTSPPFGLVRKDYGNVDSHDYLDWFRPFGHAFKHILKDSGSLVIDIGGAWISGQPTRSRLGRSNIIW